MSLGTVIKARRQMRELSLRELGRQSGLDASYLSRIENDRLVSAPSEASLRALAAALDVDLLELLAVAGTLPDSLRPLAGNRAALQFVTRAADHIKDDAEWDAMLDIVRSGELQRRAAARMGGGRA